MDAEAVQGIDAVKVDPAMEATANYAKFTSAFRSALMQSYMAGQSGKDT
jgi:collagenase-like PrtC family protease